MNYKNHFEFGNGVDFLAPDSIKLINDFIAHLWADDLSPAKIYIDSGLPLILSEAVTGQYASAMLCDEEMIEYTNCLHHEFDNAANMNW
jgi:hypothetical protein